MSETYETILWTESEQQKAQRERREFDRLLKKDVSSATFIISHPTMSSKEITKELGLKPDYKKDEGETVYQSDRFHVKQQPGCYWQIEEDEYEQDLPFFTAVLDRLLEKLFGKMPSIRRLQDTGAKMQIQYRTEQYSGVTRISLPKTTMAKLFQLGVDFVFVTTSGIDDDGDDEEEDYDEHDESEET